jgi:hypothetical protein
MTPMTARAVKTKLSGRIPRIPKTMGAKTKGIAAKAKV